MTPIQKARADLDAAQPQMDRTSAIADEITLERLRQLEREGYTPEHDDTHPGQMALAASCYAAVAGEGMQFGKTDTLRQRPPAENLWPWEADAWKPKDARRDLIRAAALIVAEIERLDRAAAKQQ